MSEKSRCKFVGANVGEDAGADPPGRPEPIAYHQGRVSPTMFKDPYYV